MFGSFKRKRSGYRLQVFLLVIFCSILNADGFVRWIRERPQLLPLLPVQPINTRRNSPQDVDNPILLSATSKNSDNPSYKNENKRISQKGKRKGKQGPRTLSRPRSKQLDPSTRLHRSETRPILCDYEFSRSNQVWEDRRIASIACEHFGQCSGCVKDDQVAETEIIQSAKLYFSSTAVRAARHDVISQGKERSVEDKDDGFYKVVIPSEVKGWRTQAKLAVAPKSSSWLRDGCEFGLYQRGSHTVLPISNCQVHHPAINKALESLRKATSKAGIAAFSRENREGGLRYVQLQVERTTGKVCLTLIWNAATLKETQPQLSRLTKELTKIEPNLWHSMWCHCNDSLGNAIFNRNPKRWHRLSGQEFMREPLAVGDQGWLYFSPFAFRQGNLDGFDVLTNDVARLVPEGSKVCELYAGVGVLGLTALAYHYNLGSPLQWLRCSDENPANPRCFQRAVESLPLDMTGLSRGRRKRNDDGLTLEEIARRIDEEGYIPAEDEDQEKTSYMVGTAVDALYKGQALGANVLIVDPPRKGLEDGVLQELCKPYNPDQAYVESINLLPMPDHLVSWTNDVQTLIYVSCGFDALARDCERILSSPAGWQLMSATGYVLFPGSDHVETVCLFQRQ